MSSAPELYQTVESVAIAGAMVWAFFLLSATDWVPVAASNEQGAAERSPMLRFGLWAIVASLMTSWITYFGQHFVLLLEDGGIFFDVPGLLFVLYFIVEGLVLTVLLAIWIARIVDWRALSAGFSWRPPRWVRATVALWLAFGVSNLVVSAGWALNLFRPWSGGPQDVFVLRAALSGLALVVASVAAYLLIRWPVFDAMLSQRGRAPRVLAKTGASAALASGWHSLVSTISTLLLEADDSIQSWPYVVEWLEPDSFATILALGTAIGFALLVAGPLLRVVAGRRVAHGNPLLGALLVVPLLASLFALPIARIGASLQLGHAEGIGALTPTGLLALGMPLVVAAVVVLRR